MFMLDSLAGSSMAATLLSLQSVALAATLAKHGTYRFILRSYAARRVRSDCTK
jgi:hypothetical protein